MELLRFITLFIGLVFFPALTSARCNFKKYAQKNSGNTTALEACISTMKPSRVDNSHCGGVNWYLSQLSDPFFWLLSLALPFIKAALLTRLL
jgi:hypothetical protein